MSQRYHFQLGDRGGQNFITSPKTPASWYACLLSLPSLEVWAGLSIMAFHSQEEFVLYGISEGVFAETIIVLNQLNFN